MKIGLLGRKIGMTRVYEANGKATPVTVIEAGENTIVQIKTEEKDGYDAVQVGFDTQKESRVTKPLLGHFKKANSAPKKFVKEFRTSAGAPVDATTKIGVDQFQPGEFVDVIGRSKGKGFQGVVKKHGFAGQPAAHGSKMHRRNGAIGNRSTPGRVWRNMGMPGHLGDDRVTVQNLRIVQVRPEENVILVCGAVPGSNGSYVVLRPAKKRQYPNGGKAE
jgi:large subunit ribosomal protein L3